MKNRIIIKYKEFLFEVLDNMRFKDLMYFGQTLAQDVVDREEHGGAPVSKIDRVTERKVDIVGKYINKHYPKEAKEYMEKHYGNMFEKLYVEDYENEEQL